MLADADRYGESFADVYDEWYGADFDTDGAVECLAALAGAGAALELGVGTGRLALPLAATGRVVVGVDASPQMLDRLAANAGSVGVATVLTDMADVGEAVPAAGLEIPADGYTLAYCAANTFLNLHSEAAQRQCLVGAAALLASDGVLVIEAYVPASPDQTPRTSLDVARVTTDAVVLTCTEHDAATQVVTGQHIEIRDGSVRLRPWQIRYLTPEQLDDLAAEAGLVLHQRWADWRGTPFDDESDSHVSTYRHHRPSASEAR